MKDFNITTIEQANRCDLLHYISNGITYCEKCNKKIHDNTKNLGGFRLNV